MQAEREGALRVPNRPTRVLAREELDMTRIWCLIRHGQPRTLVLLCALTLTGAALSPDFLSPAFPQSRLGGTVLFQRAAGALPRLFSPPMWSLWHALGAAMTVGLLWVSAVYALPSLRQRQSGLMNSLTIGAGVTFAVAFGLFAQTGVTEVGLLAAVALGMLAAASSLVREFVDIDADRRAGLRTLPILFGRKTAITVNMAAVSTAYLLALFLLLQRIGMQERVLGLFGLPLGAHLHLLRQLGRAPDQADARRAVRWAELIYLGASVLYVGVQS